MKVLLLILFLPLCVVAQKPVVISFNDTALALPQLPIPLSTCISYCGTVSGYLWSNVAGNPVLFSTSNSPTTIISGFKPGITRLEFSVNGSAGTFSDTLTLTFSVAPAPCPPPIICPPPKPCHPVDTAGILKKYCPVIPPPIPCPPADTAGIIKWYLATHPCPVCPPPVVCPICPPIPPARKAIGITWDIITNKKVITYDSGPPTAL